MLAPVTAGSERVDTETGRLLIEKTIAASRQHVWRCLTEPDCFKVWWRETVDFEPKLGGRFTEPWKTPDGAMRTTRAQVTAYHPPEGFVMVWADEDWTFDTVVSVSLEEVEGGTRISIEHQGWEKAPEAERADLLGEHEIGWTLHLANLASHAEQHRGGGDEPNEGH